MIRAAIIRSLRGLRDESGQTIIVAAVGMIVVIAFLGLAIDVGQLRFAKRNLQKAADAAALAAALEIQACNNTLSCTAMQNAASSALVENGLSGSTVVTNCASTSVSGLKLMVNNAPCALGTNDPYKGQSNYVEVLVSQAQPTYFARVLGFSTIPITARAEAARTGGANCIYALDRTGGGAISVVLSASLNSSCGIMDESSATGIFGIGGAFSCILGAVTASQINVVASAQLLSNLLCIIQPTAKTGAAVPNPADPLAYLPKPALLPCGTSTSSPYHGSASALNISSTVVLNPDAAYCGGINVLPGGHVTLAAGTYQLTSANGKTTKNPGGLTIDLGSTVTGTGVTFYNYGPNGGINFLLPSVLGGVNLTAPTSGTYAGILFFQDPQDTAAAGVYGAALWNTTLEGAYYFPTAPLNFALSGPTRYSLLVAKDISFVGAVNGTTIPSGSVVGNDYSSLANGSPIAGTGAVLIQ